MGTGGMAIGGMATGTGMAAAGAAIGRASMLGTARPIAASTRGGSAIRMAIRGPRKRPFHAGGAAVCSIAEQNDAFAPPCHVLIKGSRTVEADYG
jgi:hypothetical protein